MNTTDILQIVIGIIYIECQILIIMLILNKIMKNRVSVFCQ